VLGSLNSAGEVRLGLLQNNFERQLVNFPGFLTSLFESLKIAV
jgi:hypothetical protein